MYNPKHFQQSDQTKLQQLIAENPLCTLVANNSQGLCANHLPLLLEKDSLVGHIAKGNELWKTLVDGTAVLAIFTGVQGYISPSMYPSKKEHGKVVPTWNYQAVHVQGNIQFLHSAEDKLDIVTRLTDQHESPRPAPWQVDDAPDDYLENMLKAIVGLRITISSIEGKWKLSQNQSAQNAAGVLAELGQTKSEQAQELAKAIHNSRPELPD